MGEHKSNKDKLIQSSDNVLQSNSDNKSGICNNLAIEESSVSMSLTSNTISMNQLREMRIS